MAIGKLSFENEKLVENAKVAVDSIIKAKPPTSKGRYLKKITMSTTMGPGLRIDIGTITSLRI